MIPSKCSLTALTMAAWIMPAEVLAAPPFTVAMLVDRVTWGRTSQDVANAEQLGQERWLRQQLRPPTQASLPPSVEAKIAALRISAIPMTKLAVEMDTQFKAAAKVQDPTKRQAAQLAYYRAMLDLRQQAVTRSLLRDIYSSNQLQEQMTWFWFNHFNVQAEKRDIRAMVGDYEDQAIRPHALGNFKDLLRAADLHPAMLRYLDNDQNATGHINENYAREILELHTMGVGSGYSQKDIEEMARILTGVGVSLSPDPPKLKPEEQAAYVRRDLMEFNPARHDFGEKTVLGRKVPGAGLSEFEDMLDVLARQPATARYISRKLALFFIDDAPPKLVDRMSKAFLAHDGDIPSVLEILFHSREFQAASRMKAKDPVHYVVSAVRLTYAAGPPVTEAAPVQEWIERLGQPLYGRETPDGYPLAASAWSAPGQLTAMFEVARQIGSGSPNLYRTEGESKNTPTRPTPPALRSTLNERQVSPALASKTKDVLAKARSPAEWNALFLSSPEFLHR